MTASRAPLAVVLCLALTALVAWSAPSPDDDETHDVVDSSAPAVEDFAASLIGTWEAQPILAASGKYHVRTTFAYVLDGRFVEEDRVVTIGDEVTTERILYGKEPETGALQRFHFASNGTLGRLADVARHERDDLGRIVAIGDDDVRTPYRFVFEGVLEGAWPSTPWRFTFTVRDHDHFDVQIARKLNANFLELTKQGFTRVEGAGK